MSGTPTAAQLVEAVRLFLAEIEPQLPGRYAFHAKVAGNALAIVTRELAASPENAERATLTLLTGHDGPTAAMRSELCERLRDGRANIETPGLVDALLAAAVAQVAVDNPRYATFKRVTAS
ncbi:MAG: DUF6285 domain-containing protein [Polymorphobacter sp.]